MTPRAGAPHAHPELAATIARRLGFRPGPSLDRRVAAAVPRLLARFGLPDAGALLARLRADSPELRGLVDAVTVGESWFLRDRPQLQHVARALVPALAGRPDARGAVHILCAGCSTGEEPYSLAILLDEAGAAPDVRIVGIDASDAALDAARAGRYRAWALRGCDAGFVDRHFRREGDVWVLAPRHRTRVSFRRLNLAMDDLEAALGPGSRHVILCRNVMIYLDAATVERVAGQLARLLTPGGWLLTSPSDPMPAAGGLLVAEPTPAGLAWRRPESPRPSASPATPAAPARPLPPARSLAPSPGSAPPPRPDRAAVAEAPVDAARAALAAGDYSRVLALAGAAPDDPDLAALALRARANRDGAAATLAAARDAAARLPFAPEVHYLEALLLHGSGRDADALDALRRVLYLDPSLPVAHFTHGEWLRRAGRGAAARAAYREAARLASLAPPDERPALADDGTAGALARAARRRLGPSGAPTETPG